MNRWNLKRAAQAERWALSLALLTAATGCAVQADGTFEGTSREEEAEFRIIAGLGADHEDLTDVALSFLNSSVLANLGDENEGTDGGSSQLKSEYHFDNCRFQEASNRLRIGYASLITQLNPNAFDNSGAQRSFGRLLHTVQDFYAHSNWTENQVMRGTSNIISLGDFMPKLLTPGMNVGDGLFVLQAGIPSNWIVSGIFTAWNKVPQVEAQTNGVRTLLGGGLMTGTFSENEDSSACVSGASIPHGGKIYDGDDEPVLAKDSPDAPHHTKAKSLARAQSREEFCRASRLTMLRYGEAGRTKLNSSWGVSESEYKQHCGTSVSKVIALISASLS